MNIKTLANNIKLRFNNLGSKKRLIAFSGAFALVGAYFVISSFAATQQHVGADAKKLNKQNFVANEVLIKVKSSQKSKLKPNSKIKVKDTGIASLNRTNGFAGATSIEQIGVVSEKANTDAALFQWYKVILNQPKRIISVDSPTDKNVIDNAIKRYKADPAIEAATANYVIEASTVPNDPYYSSSSLWASYPDMWGLKKINSEGAWNTTTGSANIVVADIDTGVDRNNPDLASNMWVNTEETPVNGIDDDRNGYIDDYHGWDFYNNDNDPMDDEGHGTHTSGTIAATGNNARGVVGVNWTSKIMALKFLGTDGSGSLSDGVRALQYAADMGSKVSSNSWGCLCSDPVMDDAVKYQHDRGMVVVAAAGNNNGDTGDFSPANSDRIIAVAASGQVDQKACFSNWGPKIDVAAPGGDSPNCGGRDNYILSTRASQAGPYYSLIEPTGNYAIARGTSMAAPHVSGLAALILAKNPSLSNEEVRQIIRNGADDLGTAGKDDSYGYGRINAANSLNLASSNVLAPIITYPTSRSIINGTSLQVTGATPGPNFASYKIEGGLTRNPPAWTTLANSSTAVTTPGTLATIDTSKLAEGYNTLKLTVTDTAGKTYSFQVFDLEVNNFDGAITTPSGLFAPGQVQISGTARTNNGVPFGNYKLEWTTGSNPSAWSSSGITLTNNGTSPVSNGSLGIWDTSTLTDGQTYLLRLTVNSTGALNYQVTTSVKADKNILSGWPKVFKPGAICDGEPAQTFADLNNDGQKETIIPSADGKLHVYKKDGSNFPGFPASQSADDCYSFGRVNVVDLDNDGKKEIISMVDPGERIYITRWDGSPYPGWPTTLKHTQFRSPSVADLDGDGKKEIVAINYAAFLNNGTATIHAYRLNGTELTGFPKVHNLPHNKIEFGGMFPGYPSGVSIIDMDKDGKPEMAWSISNRIYLFDNAGSLISGWPYIVPNYNDRVMVFENPPSFGDVDGDTKPELYVFSSLDCSPTSYFCTYNRYGLIYGLNKSGSVLPGWPKSDATDGIKSGSLWTSSPSFANVDEDSNDELIGGYNNLMIFDQTGKKNLANPQPMDQQPAIADADGDGKLDFAGSMSNFLNVVRQDGSQFINYWNRDVSGSFFANPPVLADLDNNGKLELGIIGRSFNSPDSQAYLWEIPADNGPAKFEWLMYGHDPAFTSNFATTVSTGPPISPTTGGFAGIVSSPSGAPIPNVTVSVTINKKQISTTTSSTGSYSLSNLTPGTYQVKYSARNYRALTSSVTILSGQTTAKNVVLQPR